MKLFCLEMEMVSNNLERMDLQQDPVSINMIEYNLYLGGLAAAKNLDVLNQYKITHILTIENTPLPNIITDKKQFVTKFIEISDHPREDLLSYFNETDLFIKEGLSKGAVLVHCYLGKSRSATIVIAYIMKKYSITYHDAYKKVKAKRSIICPNLGFVFQLNLYRKMEYTIDRNNRYFKEHRLNVAADKVQKHEVLPHNFYDVIQHDPGCEQTSDPESAVYRCIKCRRVVATQSNLMLHQYQDEHCKKYFFIEPLSWMNCTQAIEGKLSCPKCNIKLGSFSWVKSIKCPCGVEVTPAFCLINTKVDYSHDPRRTFCRLEKAVPTRGKR